jgi:hypothetical protein
MLPAEDFVTDRVRIAGRVRPSDETGGDYFDHGLFKDGSVVFGLGDATGHGLPSALFATTARAYVRAMLRREQTLDPAIAEANDLLVDDARGGLFMVLFVAAWSPATETLNVGSAGHPGWLLRHDDDAYRILEAPGVPLGIAKEQTFGTAGYAKATLFATAEWQTRVGGGCDQVVDHDTAHGCLVGNLPGFVGRAKNREPETVGTIINDFNQGVAGRESADPGDGSEQVRAEQRRGFALDFKHGGWHGTV